MPKGFTLISAGRFSPGSSKRSSDINSKPQSGFTLIELLVAISIVAILATIGMVTYESTQTVAKDGKRISDIQEIQKALETYYNLNGSYPTTISSSSDLSNSKYFQNGITPCDPSNSPCTTGGSGYLYVPCSATSPSSYNLCINNTSFTCGSKCNATALPTPSNNTCLTSDQITSPGVSGSGYYCVKNLSN